MYSQAHKFKIGLFVVASILLGMGLLIWLGASRYFQRSQDVVAYFSETVQGLERDSPVKYRGVTVGRIKSMRMAPDARHIEVVMSLDEKFTITEDLGVQIGLLGLTGQRYLEMDRFGPSARKEPIELNFKPPYPLVTTYPSDIREIGTALDSLLRKANAIDIQKIADHVLRVASKLDGALDDPKAENLGADAGDALREIKEAARKINVEITRMQPARKFSTTMDKATEFLDEAAKTARSTEKFIYRTDNNLNLLSQKLNQTADNLIDFSQMIKIKPSSIIFGPEEKPKKKQ